MFRRITVLSALVVAVIPAVVAGAQDEPKSAEEVYARLSEVVKDVDAWSADIEVNMSQMGMPMVITGKTLVQGEQSRNEMTMNMMGQPIQMLQILDAEGIQWSDVNAMGQRQVMKLDVAKADEMGLPQALGAGPFGASNEFAASPKETLEQFRDEFEMEYVGTETVNDTETYVLEGAVPDEMDPEAGHPGMPPVDFDKMRVYLGVEDGFARKTEMYDPDGEVLMSMVMDNVNLNPTVEAGAFDYTPPEGVAVMDLAAMMSEAISDAPETAGFEIGQAAPDFTALGPDGKEVKLSDYKGKVVLLDFWATWCAPCIQELPNVIDTYEKYKDDGFEIIGISLDDEKEALTSFLAERDAMTWPQVFDGKGWESEVGALYGVEAIPATFLLDREGKIIAMSLRGEALGEAVGKALEK